MNLIHLHHSMEEASGWFPIASSLCKINLDHFVYDHKELSQLWNVINEKLNTLGGIFTDQQQTAY